jgi:hypothetical protein
MARGVGGIGPANIMKHIKGIHFPASKDDILEIAKKGPGPDTDKVLSVLEKISDQEYNSPAEILKAIGKIE